MTLPKPHRSGTERVPVQVCFAQSAPSPSPGTKGSPHESSWKLCAHLLGGVLAWRSLLLASRGSPGLAGSGAGAVVLGACAGAGGGAGFFTAFSLCHEMEGQPWWRGPASDCRGVTEKPGRLLIPYRIRFLECF